MTGSGVIKGMAVTLRQFFSTYGFGRFLLRVVGKKGDGIYTVSYPEQRQTHAERLRVFPFLVYDREPDDLRCVSCKICEQECPPQCIHIVQAKDDKGAPLKKHGRAYPLTFDIDVSICMSCRICVDVCPFDAIEMDNEFELSGYSRGRSMNYDINKLLKSAEYFESIKPSEFAEVESRLIPKREKAAAQAAKTKAALVAKALETPASVQKGEVDPVAEETPQSDVTPKDNPPAQPKKESEA